MIYVCAFFVPMREVSHDLIDKLIHYDPKRAMAFIAISEASREMLGVVGCTMMCAVTVLNSPSFCAPTLRDTGWAGS
jgi:hypothetical protein